jgi:hypothetical protein
LVALHVRRGCCLRCRIRVNVKWLEWSKGALYIAAYLDRLSNIWYFSSRTLPLFIANFYRDMLRLPRIGAVYIPMERRKVTPS